MVKDKCELINPYSQIDWNLDKHYLMDLQKWNLPIPESIFVPKKSNLKLDVISSEKNWNHIGLQAASTDPLANPIKNEEIKRAANPPA